MQKKKMKIGVDVRALLSGRVSGVENYVLNMLEEMFGVGEGCEFVLWVNAYGKFEFPGRLRRENVRCVQSRWPNKFLNLSLAFFGWPGVERFFPEKIDVLWVPDPRPVVVRGTPLVTTFHDLSPEVYPQFFNLKTRMWHKLLNARGLAERSDKIIAVSEATKRDLVEWYGVGEERVQVVYEAPVGELGPVGRGEVERVREKYGLPERYVLTLSTLELRKNLERLLLAFQLVRAALKCEVGLVVAGVTNEKIFADLPEFGGEEGVVFAGFVAEEDKAAVYAGAEFFINVSLLEGFGLPVVEALACGVPCLVANNSALMEVAGEAGLGVDPTRVSAVAAGLMALLKQPERLEEMRGKALGQARKFSWRKAAGEVLEVFEGVLGKH